MKTLRSHGRGECVHSRNVFSHMDMKASPGLRKHVSECPVCRELHGEIKKMAARIDEKIPPGRLSPDALARLEDSCTRALERFAGESGKWRGTWEVFRPTRDMSVWVALLLVGVFMAGALLKLFAV